MSIQILRTFRDNVKNMDEEVRDAYLSVPPGVKELFEQFLDAGNSMSDATTKEDIMNLLMILCNTGQYEWDEIAHNFL